jgi:hypothetical protein
VVIWYLYILVCVFYFLFVPYVNCTAMFVYLFNVVLINYIIWVNIEFKRFDSQVRSRGVTAGLVFR